MSNYYICHKAIVIKLTDLFISPDISANFFAGMSFNTHKLSVRKIIIS